MEQFDLRDLIRRTAIAHSSVASPAVLAELVMEDVPPEQYQSLVAKLLPRYVGELLRRSRNTPTTDEQKWDSFLTERVSIGSGSYRFAADCSVADLRGAASRRQRMAGNLDRRASLYNRVAEAVADAHVHVPRELPVELGIASITDLTVRVATAQSERLAAERALKTEQSLRVLREETLRYIDRQSTPRLDTLRAEITAAQDRLKKLDESVIKARTSIERIRAAAGAGDL